MNLEGQCTSDYIPNAITVIGLDDHKHLWAPLQRPTHLSVSNVRTEKEGRCPMGLGWDWTKQNCFGDCYNRSEARSEWLNFLKMTIGQEVAFLSIFWADLLWSQIKQNTVCIWLQFWKICQKKIGYFVFIFLLQSLLELGGVEVVTGIGGFWQGEVELGIHSPGV